MATNWLSNVTKIKNGDDVSAEIINPILDQHLQRDQHIFERLNELESKSVLVDINRQVDATTTLAVNDVVFYSETGLKKAKAGFSYASEKTKYSPLNSSFVAGILYQYDDTVKLASLYTRGLISVSNFQDLLEVGETPRVGPYYLSSSTEGKLTANYGGFAVFVGYLLPANSGVYKQFYLNPGKNELVDFFESFKYGLIDRPAGTPVLAGGTWTITATDTTKLGWIPAASQPGAPVGAKFKYNIPSETNINTDTTLTLDEKNEAIALKASFPPQPNHFHLFFINGVVVERSVSGVYEINDSGIWWFLDAEEYAPWAKDLPSGTWVVADWSSVKGTDEFRPKQSLYFSRFNPTFKSFFVTSLKPTSNSLIKFYDANNPTQEASSGDLLAGVLDTINTVTVSPDLPTAVKSLSVVNNTLRAEVGSVVSSIVPGTGISAVTDPQGNVTISSQSATAKSFVPIIEPLSSTYKFKGLHSYLEFSNPATITTGLAGKILLPPVLPAEQNLFLELICFTETASGNTDVGFKFAYSVSQNSTAFNTAIVYQNFDVNLQTAQGGTSVANKQFSIENAVMQVPYTAFTVESIVNFQIIRKVPTGTAFTGNLNVLAVTWRIGA